MFGAFVCTNFISHGDFALWLDLFLLPDFFIKIRVPGADYVWRTCAASCCSIDLLMTFTAGLGQGL